MDHIDELTPVKVADFKKAIRKSKKQAKVARRLMLDLLAKAYDSETLIHHVYYDRANEILNFAQGYDDTLWKAIMKKEGLI